MGFFNQQNAQEAYLRMEGAQIDGAILEVKVARIPPPSGGSYRKPLAQNPDHYQAPGLRPRSRTPPAREQRYEHRG